MTHGCLCVAESSGTSAVRYGPYHAVLRHHERLERLFPGGGPEDPFFPNELGERGSKAAFQGTVDKAAEFLALPTHGPRGEALYTGHVRRKTGAEALTAGGTEVAVTQILIRRGKRTVLYYGQEPPWASSFADRRQAPPARALHRHPAGPGGDGALEGDGRAAGVEARGARE